MFFLRSRSWTWLCSKSAWGATSHSKKLRKNRCVMMCIYDYIYIHRCIYMYMYLHVCICTRNVMWCDLVWCDVMWRMHAYIISICIHCIACVIIYIICWFTFLLLPIITPNLVHWSDHTKVVVAGLKEGLKPWKSPKRQCSVWADATVHFLQEAVYAQGIQFHLDP